MKKFFVTMMLAVALVFVGSQAEAREVYVGSYTEKVKLTVEYNKVPHYEVYVGSYSDGTAVYLLTDSIRSNGRQGVQDYTCRVRAGRDYLDYHFWYGNVWEYSNSEGYSGRVYDGSSPVAAAILNYIRNR